MNDLDLLLSGTSYSTGSSSRKNQATRRPAPSQPRQQRSSARADDSDLYEDLDTFERRQLGGQRSRTPVKTATKSQLTTPRTPQKPKSTSYSSYSSLDSLDSLSQYSRPVSLAPEPAPEPAAEHAAELSSEPAFEYSEEDDLVSLETLESLETPDTLDTLEALGAPASTPGDLLISVQPEISCASFDQDSTIVPDSPFELIVTTTTTPETVSGAGESQYLEIQNELNQMKNRLDSLAELIKETYDDAKRHVSLIVC